ncbi:heterocyst formation ABC transporter subunit HepA [Allocoleopsis franciscana]|uniref:ABC-type multidrug transport system, ATPase and permease component n=1 Tax=Allocoleopsis franciscana PCC 7113 TaxID=1173027 RepID=K9W884_9CYAN|nr:heterocyst formation ABC transporter subunit HepA [Allocoleopsis franciscana]AFZ16036.1 ABC-type multidrug transport system, ATPase and permease component [Allocoleopsis franciscana PCC 7113]
MHLKLPRPIRSLLKATNFWQNNYLILREFKHFPQIALLALLFTFLAATFEGVGIGFLLSFLQSLTTPNANPVQTGIEWFDIWILGINTSATSRLYRISALILLTTWTRAAFNYLASIYTELAQLNLLDRLRKQIFEQLQALSLSYFAKTRSGELINTITTEIERIKQVFGGFAFLLTSSLTAAVYFLSMFLLSWQLTVISMLLFTLLAVGLSTLNARIREASFGVTKASGQFTSTAMEFINGIRTVQAFATQDFERKQFYGASSNIVSSYGKAIRAWAVVKPLAEGLATTILISMIIVAFTVFVANGTLQVASLLTFFFVLFRLVPSLQSVNNVMAQLSTLYGSADNIKELLRTDNKKYFKNGETEFSGLKRSIDFISVDFGYDASNLVLHDITLTIERGQMTALVGGSGAGKTTLADLIPRFYDPTRGNVLIDGVDLREFEINSLRRKLAVVSQDTFIFNTSVRNNIAYGTEGASEDEILEAARLANAVEFIQEMPDGFETQLGDRGVRLSGGQRQRLAIARALLRNPEILILDEATSALDSVSERLIQESLEKLSIGRTVIAIAHRLSTIASADKVVVLEQGQIVEQGKYQELLEQRGKLWKYHQMQHESGYVG